MKLKRLVFAILPLLLLSSCSSTGSSSSPVEENKATEKELAETNLKKDDLSQIKVYEYRYEGDSFYYRSIVWNGKKKAPSLFVALTEEDKTEKANYSERDGSVDTSFYYFYIPRKNSDSIKDCLYVQKSTSDKEQAGYTIASDSGMAYEDITYIFDGLNSDITSMAASIREEVAPELEKEEFVLDPDYFC